MVKLYINYILLFYEFLKGINILYNQKTFFSGIILTFIFLKLPTGAYTPTLSLLTEYSLTQSSVRIMLLKTWQRWKNHTLAKLLQGFRQHVTSLLGEMVACRQILETFIYFPLFFIFLLIYLILIII